MSASPVFRCKPEVKLMQNRARAFQQQRGE